MADGVPITNRFAISPLNVLETITGAKRFLAPPYSTVFADLCTLDETGVAVLGLYSRTPGLWTQAVFVPMYDIIVL